MITAIEKKKKGYFYTDANGEMHYTKDWRMYNNLSLRKKISLQKVEVQIPF